MLICSHCRSSHHQWSPDCPLQMKKTLKVCCLVPQSKVHAQCEEHDLPEPVEIPVSPNPASHTETPNSTPPTLAQPPQMHFYFSTLVHDACVLAKLDGVAVDHITNRSVIISRVIKRESHHPDYKCYYSNVECCTSKDDCLITPRM